jgi:hypothetical protein
MLPASSLDDRCVPPHPGFPIEMGVLTTFFCRLAWNCDHLNLSLPMVIVFFSLISTVSYSSVSIIGSYANVKINETFCRCHSADWECVYCVMWFTHVNIYSALPLHSNSQAGSPSAFPTSSKLLGISLGSAGVWTQGLALTSQALYHSSHAPNPFGFSYFLVRGSLFAQGWLWTMTFLSQLPA